VLPSYYPVEWGNVSRPGAVFRLREAVSERFVGLNPPRSGADLPTTHDALERLFGPPGSIVSKMN